jgi:hypothetical protein
MWYSFRLFRGDLIRDDWQAMIKLHRISIDNFSIKLARYLNSQLPAVISTFECMPRSKSYIRLARASCTHDGNQRLFGRLRHFEHTVESTVKSTESKHTFAVALELCTRAKLDLVKRAMTGELKRGGAKLF